MKIAISHANASYMMGGSVVYVWRLTRYLQDHGHDVWLIAGEVAEPVVLDPAVRLKMF